MWRRAGLPPGPSRLGLLVRAAIMPVTVVLSSRSKKDFHSGTELSRASGHLVQDLCEHPCSEFAYDLRSNHVRMTGENPADLLLGGVLPQADLAQPFLDVGKMLGLGQPADR